jgi:Spy/CpxP family protein refolding chaperone
MRRKLLLSSIFLLLGTHVEVGQLAFDSVSGPELVLQADAQAEGSLRKAGREEQKKLTEEEQAKLRELKRRYDRLTSGQRERVDRELREKFGIRRPFDEIFKQPDALTPEQREQFQKAMNQALAKAKEEKPPFLKPPKERSHADPHHFHKMVDAPKTDYISLDAAQKAKLFQMWENTSYSLGLYAYGVSAEEFNRVSASIREAGYSVTTETLLQNKTSWLALSSTVFYYHSDGEGKAKELANSLTKLTGTKFEFAIDLELAVVKGQEKPTLSVHYVGKE